MFNWRLELSDEDREHIFELARDFYAEFKADLAAHVQSGVPLRGTLTYYPESDS